MAVFLASGQTAKPVAGANVNMVSGTKWGTGDPFLTKQNEPSAAVSSLNPQHLLAGSNDYRLIDFTQFNEIPGDTSSPDAWVSVYKSVDGGLSWKSQVLGGCPQNIPECNNPLSSKIKGLQFAADPTVRSGPYGTFFYSFIAGNRGDSAGGVVAVQRFLDRNNTLDVASDPFQADVVNIIDTGTTGQFKDKPWNASDIPGRSWNAGATCTLPNYSAPVPAFNVYVSYSNFVGQSNSNSHPQVLVARSTDCGATFEKAVKVSNSLNTNSGSSLAIDPLTGYVYVTWRQFGTSTNGDPDAIYVSVSTDGGSKFSNPALISTFTPFDQGTSVVSFRTNALPTIAVSVKNGVSRVHVAWAQRTGANGDARIVMSTSSDGRGSKWSAPVAIDNWTSDPANPVNPGRGHQIQPALTFAAGKLTAVWYDQRYDSTVGVLVCPSGTTCSNVKQLVEVRRPVGNLADNPPGLNTVFTTFLTDGTPGLKKRHTLEVFTAMADPDNPCLVSGSCQAFVSSRVSRFRMGNRKLNSKGSAEIQQFGSNPPNLPIFVKGTASFLGDYIDVANRQFVPTGNAAKPYRFNTEPGENAVFHAVWTDNRDIVPPKDGNWANYTPISQIVNVTNGGTTTTTTVLSPNCAPGQEGNRNQNIYTARISEGSEIFAPANFKKLDTGAARGFVVTVKNSLTTTRQYTLTIQPPSGVVASFLQNLSQAAVLTLTLNVGPNSSVSRTVWASSSTGAIPAVPVVISDGSGKTSTVYLNPDPLGAPIPNVDLTNVDLTNVDLTNITVKNVDLTNVDLTNVDLTNVDLTNVDLTNSSFRNVDLTNVDLTNVDLTNVDLTNVDLTNVDLTNVDLTNLELSNVDLTNTSYTNVDLTNVDLTNVDLTNSAIGDATATLINRSNTDVSVNVKTLLRGNSVPVGFKLQLALRKVSLDAAPKGCKIGFTQQNTQVANVPPKITDPSDPTLGTFNATSGDVSNATISLSAGERAYVTMRVVAPTQELAREFGQNAMKFIGIGPSGTRTPIPLVIQTLALSPVNALTTTFAPLRSFGGTGKVTWQMSMADGSPIPSWLSVASITPLANDPTGTGRLTITNPIPGTYRLTFTVTDDQSQPIQSDTQNLTLLVNPAPQAGITFSAGGALPSSIPVGGTVTGIQATGSSGLPATIAVSGPCSLTGSPSTGYTLAAISPGSCVLTATQDGLVNGVQLYASITISAPPIAVTKGQATLSLDAATLSQVYTGGPRAVTVTTNPAGLSGATVTYNGSTTVPVNAGSYAVTATLSNSNYDAAPVSGTLVVAKAAATVTLSGLAWTYDGQPHPATVVTNPANLPYTITYNGASTVPVGAGPYSVVVTITDINYSGAASATLVIGQAVATLSLGNLNQVYDGTVKSATVTTLPAGLTGVNVSYTGARIDAGSYPVTATLTNSNYTAAPVSGTLVIAQAAAVVTLSNLTQAFDGTPKPVTVTTVPSGLAYNVTYDGSATAPSLVGTYNVLATVTNPNYAGTASGTLTIRQDLFTSTGNMTQARTWHTATLLANGQVLVAGGLDAGGASTATAEVWDPAAGTFQAVGNMPSKSAGHAAARLADGRVLITGGGNSSSELYDPATRAFAPAGGMSSNRSYHTSTLLSNGKVLIAGGSDNSGKTAASTILFDPANSSFTAGPNLSQARELHTATVLPNGKVLIAGGRVKQGSSYVAIASLELYDPATNTVTSAGALTAGRYSHVAVLSGSTVVLAGGSNGSVDLASAELYNATTGAVTSGGTMASARSAAAGAAISSGRVLVAGGQSGASALSSSAVYNAGFSAGPAMQAARANHTATALPDGRVLVTGGNGSNGVALGTAEVFSSKP